MSKLADNPLWIEPVMKCVFLSEGTDAKSNWVHSYSLFGVRLLYRL